MQIAAVSVQHLSCQRSGEIVVSDVSFKVEVGKVLILRGANGSGKTTLLRTLAGFIEPASGMMSLLHSPPEARQTNWQPELCHYFGHANGIKARLTVLENVRFWQKFYGESEPVVPAGLSLGEQALEAFGLLHLADYRAAHLSQGQARRLGLTRLLAARRSIWLLDEPSVSLDATSVRRLEQAIARHTASGGVAIIATHGDLAVPNADVCTLGFQAAA